MYDAMSLGPLMFDLKLITRSIVILVVSIVQSSS